MAIRRLRAEIELKDLIIGWIAKEAGLRFPDVSAILNGRRNDPSQLARVRNVVSAAPTPEDAL